MKLKSLLYKQEQDELVNKIINILELDNDNSIILYNLDNDKNKQDKIPTSPFTKKTLINTYLLNSEFYEVDLTSIISNGWKQTIRKYKTD